MSIVTFIPKVIRNRFLIWSKLDRKVWPSDGRWKSFKYDPSKTIQQNAGFSHTPEVEAALQIVKNKLASTLDKHVQKGSAILDIGCGPGIYMDMLKEAYEVVGVDISQEMLQSASHKLPKNKFYCGNFMDIDFNEHYSAIYSISVLEYIPVSRIDDFFNKCASLLCSGGILFIQYPHALRIRDLLYPNLNYINYSSKFISRTASKYFRIIENNHSFDGRPACWYDNNAYPTATCTFKNGFVLIAQKV